MATGRLSIALRARRAGGTPVQKEEVLAPLGLEERVAVVAEDRELSSLRLQLAYGDADETLRRAARWLMDQDAAAFQTMRDAGLQLDLEVVVHAEGRAAVRLPPSLLVATGRRDLPISIIFPEQE